MFSLSKTIPQIHPSTPTGETSGNFRVSYVYESSTTDPDGDLMYYFWDWGDGNSSGWLGPFTSGTVHNASHAWAVEGIYNIKVKARDTSGAESLWSDSLTVTISFNYSVSKTSICIGLIMDKSNDIGGLHIICIWFFIYNFTKKLCRLKF